MGSIQRYSTYPTCLSSHSGFSSFPSRHSTSSNTATPAWSKFKFPPFIFPSDLTANKQRLGCYQPSYTKEKVSKHLLDWLPQQPTAATAIESQSPLPPHITTHDIYEGLYLQSRVVLSSLALFHDEVGATRMSVHLRSGTAFIASGTWPNPFVASTISLIPSSYSWWWWSYYWIVIG